MRLNIFSTKKIVFAACYLLFIGLLAGSVVAFGQTPTPTETSQANPTPTPEATPTPTEMLRAPAQTGMTLGISADPSILTVNTPTPVTLTVTSNGIAVQNATVTLGGVVTANGITNAAGNIVVIVNATAEGIITAKASATGYAIGTTTLEATGTSASASWFEGFIVFVLILIVSVFILTNVSKKFEHNKMKIGMFISLLILFISFGVWIVEALSSQKIDILGVLGAGVFGGIVLDIAVNKGEYILPATEEDGIYLGALYGAAVGLVIAIATIASHYTNITVTDSLAVFVAAATVKGASEYVSADTLIKKKKKASISFNLKDDEGKVTEEGVIYKSTSVTNFNGEGEILISGKVNEPQVVHLNFQKDNLLVVKDTQTNAKSLTKFENIDITDVKWDAGTWEAWASWDGNDAYDKSESIHRMFTIVEQVLTTVTVSKANPSVKVGSTQTFTASPKDQFGNQISTSVKWSSSDTKVGTIDENTGLFTAKAKGTTTITATADNVSGPTTVTVE